MLCRFTLKKSPLKNLRPLQNPRESFPKNLRNPQNLREINLPIKQFSPKISAKIRAHHFHPNLISPNLKVFPRKNLNFENQIHFLEFR